MDILNPQLSDLRLDIPLHAEFYKRCKAHDLTCDYSDDHEVAKRGWAEKAAIKNMAKSLPRAEAMAIWNYVVIEKVTAPSSFLWRE